MNVGKAITVAMQEQLDRDLIRLLHEQFDRLEIRWSFVPHCLTCTCAGRLG